MTQLKHWSDMNTFIPAVGRTLLDQSECCYLDSELELEAAVLVVKSGYSPFLGYRSADDVVDELRDFLLAGPDQPTVPLSSEFVEGAGYVAQVKRKSFHPSAEAKEEFNAFLKDLRLALQLSSMERITERVKNISACRDNSERRDLIFELMEVVERELGQEQLSASVNPGSEENRREKIVRCTLLAMAFSEQKEKEYGEGVSVEQDEPREQLFNLVPFFGHILNTSIVREALLVDQEIAGIAERALYPAAIEKCVSQYVEETETLSGEENKTKVLFHPTRAFLGDLSGYICRTCLVWSEYLMDINRNATFVAFAKEAPPNGEGRSLQGGAYVIKTQTADRQGAYFVTGFNPSSSLISKVDTLQLFVEFCNWLKEIAPKDIKKIVIPMDPKVGELLSNFPEVFMRIESQYRDAPEIELLSEEEIRFRRDDRVQRCVVISTLGED